MAWISSYLEKVKVMVLFIQEQGAVQRYFQNGVKVRN